MSCRDNQAGYVLSVNDDSSLFHQQTTPHTQDTNVGRKPLSADQVASLVQEHWEIAQKFAWSLIRQWQVRMRREDVLSIVGHSLCEAAKRFDVDRGSSFTTFLYYHLRGLLIKDIAKAQRAQKLRRAMIIKRTKRGSSVTPVYYPCAETNTPEQLLQDRQLARLCWSACVKLKPLEREVILKHYVHDQPIVEIARELGYCRSYISRVKTRASSVVKRQVFAQV